MTRIRTVSQAYQIIHREDPDSSISKQFLYQQIKSGNLPCIRQGSRFLIDLDSLPMTLEKIALDKTSNYSMPIKLRRTL